ncbi:MAG: diguanylate cyclase [Candidatus Omnitrophica bacterium]|nr:diguanylate cyclase [Candidatus Omnitrophota bacterium]
MKKVFYCIDKASKRKIGLPFSFKKIKKVKDLQGKGLSVVIFDEHFAHKHSPPVTQLVNNVCFIHFLKEDKSNSEKAKKYGFFDYFSDEESKQEILFKIDKAQSYLEQKERIGNLEREIINKDKRIKEIVLVDSLTGCYNWRYFLHRTRQELSRARRHLQNIAFIAIDIDYFRQINELYGTYIADCVIKELVALLKQILRREDVLTRWRDDEFFIVLPYLSRENAYQVANRLKDKISLHKFKYKKFGINIKVSLGVVSFPGDNVYNTKDIINALHECLAVAKKKGGNRVILYTPRQREQFVKEKKGAGFDIFKTKIEKLNTLLTRDLLEMIYGFARAIEAKDYYTGRHVEYTSMIAEKIAQELNLPPSEIENIKHAAVLHDLGKVGISERILSKKGRLNESEKEIIKAHPWTAAEILREIHALRGAIPAILYHHERYDGKGYPLGLKGEEIPLSARIVALADVYQALVSDRPYRKAYNKKMAVDIIKKETGDHFDPKITKVFLKIINKIKQ